jgi:hypothetical protein
LLRGTFVFCFFELGEGAGFDDMMDQRDDTDYKREWKLEMNATMEQKSENVVKREARRIAEAVLRIRKWREINSVRIAGREKKYIDF